jgi:hypothetical protein
MQLDRTIRIGDAEGEDVLPLLCFRNGHDGGLAVTISVAPFRLACLNGMILPLNGAGRTGKARHTANLDARLVDARRTLGIAWRYYDELERVGGRLIREQMSPAGSGFVAQLVPPRGTPDVTNGGRAVRNVGVCAKRDRRQGTPDLANITGTRWRSKPSAYVDRQTRRATAAAVARFERATGRRARNSRASRRGNQS